MEGKTEKVTHEAEDIVSVYFEILTDVLMIKFGCEKYRCYCWFTNM